MEDNTALPCLFVIAIPLMFMAWLMYITYPWNNNDGPDGPCDMGM